MIEKIGKNLYDCRKRKRWQSPMWSSLLICTRYYQQQHQHHQRRSFGAPKAKKTYKHSHRHGTRSVQGGERVQCGQWERERESNGQMSTVTPPISACLYVSVCVFVMMCKTKNKKNRQANTECIQIKARRTTHCTQYTRLTVIELIASVSQVMQAGRQAKQTSKERKRESANGNVF